MPEAASCMKASQTMVDTPMAVALKDHGDMDDRPRPTPSISRMKDKAAAAAAPASTAPQETPAWFRSVADSCVACIGYSPGTWLVSSQHGPPPFSRMCGVVHNLDIHATTAHPCDLLHAMVIHQVVQCGPAHAQQFGRLDDIAVGAGQGAHHDLVFGRLARLAQIDAVFQRRRVRIVRQAQV